MELHVSDIAASGRYDRETGRVDWLDDRKREGFAAAGWTPGKKHQKRVKEAARLYADVLSGREDPILFQEAINPKRSYIQGYLLERYPGLRPDFYGGRNMMPLRETMSVTDYQALFVDVIDRLYYGFYSGYPIVNKPLVRIHQLRDFRVVSRYLLDGAVSALAPVQAGIPGDAASPWKQTALVGPNPQDGSPATSTAPIQYAPLLYQAGTSVNWRAFVNDDLGIFRDLSQRLALQANRGISKLITGFYVSSTGPNPTLYQTGYKNQINVSNGAASNNPPFSTQGMMDALKVLANMRDSSGEPIMMTGRMYLWYGPSLTAAVQNVLHAMSVWVQNEGGTGNIQGFPSQFVQTANWVVQNITPIMDPYIPIVCTTGGIQNTMWGITIDPGSQNRPCTEFGFLNGFETPQIFTKVPNTMRLGGGVDPTMGDFYSMDQDMKIVTVMGGTNIDGRSTVASTGAGV